MIDYPDIYHISSPYLLFEAYSQPLVYILFPILTAPAPVQLSPAQSLDHNDGDGKNLGHMAEGMGSEGRKHM